MTGPPLGDGRAGAGLRIGAVLLAAGGGRRLGGCAKALLELDGVPLVRRQVEALAGVGAAPLVVVLGHHAAAVAAALDSSPAWLLRNPDPDRGQSCSLRLGLAELPDLLDAVVVALVDQPLIEARHLLPLIERFGRRSGADMVVPRVAGAPGNPVIISAQLRSDWLANSALPVGRQWREDFPQRVAWYDTTNPCYRFDIDTPDDIARFNQLGGRRLAWPVART